VNIERAEQEQASEAREAVEKEELAKRREAILTYIDPSLIVNQRLDEVLG